MTSIDRSDEYVLGRPLDFLRKIWRFNHALERMSNRMQRTMGVTAQQRLLVRCIGKYPGLTAGQLAGLLHLDPGTVSAALHRLEEREILTRRRDPRDKRRVTIGLTALGRSLDHPQSHTVESAIEQLFVEAHSDDIEATKRVLDRLALLLDADAEELSVRIRTRPAPSR